MDAILDAGHTPPSLRAGFQPAIAAGESDRQAAVELELISLLGSAAFRASARSAAFLKFVVEEALAGRQEQLKERTIGTAVLGKPLAYDTGADSGVRVRANEVRKRLASHYQSASPKAGIRIELPPGTYIPRFVSAAAAEPVAPPPAAMSAQVPPVPPMQFWQLAAPSLVAVFLALVAIRGGVESNDSFSRFWNHALAGKTSIAIAIDPESDDADGARFVSSSVADAALPLESLATIYQIPVRLVVLERYPEPSGACVVRMSLRRPAGPALLRLGDAAVFQVDGGPLWIWAESPEKLRAAAQTLSSPSSFPQFQ